MPKTDLNGHVIRFRNDLKFKGMDEYVSDEAEGLLTDNINEAYIFGTPEDAQRYHATVFKGVTPKGHMDPDFPAVSRTQVSIVQIIRED